jgi:hypothetical protein
MFIRAHSDAYICSVLGGRAVAHCSFHGPSAGDSSICSVVKLGVYEVLNRSREELGRAGYAGASELNACGATSSSLLTGM